MSHKEQRRSSRGRTAFEYYARSRHGAYATDTLRGQSREHAALVACGGCSVWGACRARRVRHRSEAPAISIFPITASICSVEIIPGRSRGGLAPARESTRRFDAHLSGAAIQDEIDGVAQRLPNMLGGGGRELGEAVGAGSGDGHAGCREQRQSANGLRGHAEAD